MNHWKLTRGGEVLAFLHVDGIRKFVDHQAVEASYRTTTAFGVVCQLFEREVELLDIDGEPENTEWIEVWDELQDPDLFVESPDGQIRLAILWIHFKDIRAWWFPLYNDPQTKTPPVSK